MNNAAPVSVTAMRAAQAERLTRLRELLDMEIGEAGEVAGVSRDAWSRMERGVSHIDTVALARFSAHIGLPSEYVISGSYLGMPDHVIRAVTEAELRARLGLAAHTESAERRKPRGRKRQRHKADNGA